MTVAEIAKEVGCTRITVYNYLEKLFPDFALMPTPGMWVSVQIPKDKAEAVISAMRWAGLGPAEKAPGPRVRELAVTLGVSESVMWRFVGELCPNHNVRLSPAEVEKVTHAIQNREPKVSRYTPTVSCGVTVSELAKRLGVHRNTVLRVFYAKFPANKGCGITSTGGRQAIVFTARQVEVISEEVASLIGADGKLRLGPKPGTPNLRHFSKRGKPKNPGVVPVHSKSPNVGSMVEAVPPSLGETEPLPAIEDIVMQVLAEREVKPGYSISMGNLARAFRWDPDDLRLVVYTKFPGMLAVPGESSIALTPNELLRRVATGLQAAGVERKRV